MTTLLRDARHALRSALRRPGVPLVVVLTLAVGIGANSAIFTYLIEVYRAKVPVPDPGRVFWIRTGTVAEPGGMSSYLDAEAYREATAALGDSAVRAGWGAVVELPQGGTSYRVGLAVNAEYFPLLGARFALGRGFLPQEDRPDGRGRGADPRPAPGHAPVRAERARHRHGSTTDSPSPREVPGASPRSLRWPPVWSRCSPGR